VAWAQDSRGASHCNVEVTSDPTRAEKVEHALAAANLAANGCPGFFASCADTVVALDEEILHVLIRDIWSTTGSFVTGFDLVAGNVVRQA
jgi:hypothetical protein